MDQNGLTMANLSKQDKGPAKAPLLMRQKKYKNKPLTQLDLERKWLLASSWLLTAPLTVQGHFVKTQKLCNQKINTDSNLHTSQIKISNDKRWKAQVGGQRGPDLVY